MANIESAKKRAKTNEKRRLRNLARRSDLKSAVKKVSTALDAHDKQAAQASLKLAESKIARAKTKGILKKNTAARKIGSLAKKVAREMSK